MKQAWIVIWGIALSGGIGCAGLGEQIYHKCSRCHGADGLQSAYGKTRSIAGMPAEQVAQDLRAYRAGTLDRYGLGHIMHVRLDDRKIRAVSAYIEALRHP